MADVLMSSRAITSLQGFLGILCRKFGRWGNLTRRQENRVSELRIYDDSYWRLSIQEEELAIVKNGFANPERSLYIVGIIGYSIAQSAVLHSDNYIPDHDSHDF
jgi:hypothetical protein